ncbi:uncharacterized protein LOC129754035 [Uranotaenia lowii]|uniref:uncharacterized protein LOC129754035 n=1 Tax=Uranotaenia lowii TaxID=190385 RepID=UPI002478D2C7|nr:uncharacterized protein LOC129754035 [Uranotaenia lowii]
MASAEPRNSTDAHCLHCDKPDNDRMVGCDLCSNWAHYECAGVSDSIENPDRSWRCQACTSVPLAPNVSSQKSDARSVSTRRSRVDQELMLLKEQHELEIKALAEEEAAAKKKAEEDEAARKRQATSEKELRKKRYDMEAKYIKKRFEAVMEAGSGSVSSKRSSREKVSEWLANGTTGNMGQNAPTEWELPQQPSSSSAQAFPASALPNEVQNISSFTSAEIISHTIVAPTSSSTPHASLVVPSTVTTSNQVAFCTTSSPHIRNDPAVGLASGIHLPSAIRWSSKEISPTTMLQMISNERQNQLQNDLVSKAAIRSTPRPYPPHLAMRTDSNIMTSVCRGSIPSVTTAGPYVSTGTIPKIPSKIYAPRCTAVHNPIINTPEPLPVSIESSRNSNRYPGFTQGFNHDIAHDISTIVSPLAQLTIVEQHQRPSSSIPTGGELHNTNRALPTSTHGVPFPIMADESGKNVISYQMPSAAQLAARQVIARELPYFSGDPQDWPLFYGTYQNSTMSCGFSYAENLSRLQRCLRGPALEAVKSKLTTPESVPQILDILKRLYGRPEIIIHSLLKTLRKTAPPKEDNLRSIITFALAVQNTVDHMITTNLLEHLCNPTLIQELVEKLPPQMQMHWSWFKRQYTTVNLEVFGLFMTELMNTASDVIMPEVPTRNENTKKVGKEKHSLFTHVAIDNPTEISLQTEYPKKACIFCGYTGHEIVNCEIFQSLNKDARWNAVKEKKLCRLCLIPHKKWPCRSTRQCNVDGCRVRHHPLLHPQSAANPSTSAASNVSIAHHHTGCSFSLFRYLPIVVQANGKSIEVIAFLDDGSSSTMLEASVATELGIEGQTDPLWLSWTGNVTREEKKSQRISVIASGLSLKKMYRLNNVRTVEKLLLPSQSMDYEYLKNIYPHLRGLPVKGYAKVTPSMIIGIEHATLLTSLKIREGGANDPIATKTRLGWCVFGKQLIGSQAIETVSVHCEAESCDRELHELIRRLLKVEESRAEGHVTDSEKRALAILEATTRRVDGRFETGLLFKHPEQRFPNSFSMAERRLQSLEKRLAKDPFLENKIREQIQQYLEKGYAHLATTQELQNTDPEKTWYLPLGVVQNPKKPEKIRLIWDAAARVQGISFNDALLTGPDLLTSLPDILVRFRQRDIAITGDIKEMFHQIRIRNPDKQYQRFLFRENPHQQPQVYVMDVATFGATCSPCIAQFVKNRNAMEYATEFPQAASDIVNEHYMDDYLKSVDTPEEAVKIVNQVKLIHAQGGFEIRNFASNSTEVLEKLGESKDTREKVLSLEQGISTKEKSERVLGMVWKPHTDVFTFDATFQAETMRIIDLKVIPTKRQVLKIVMSLFDPLGLIAHFIVHGKILMQEIWKYGCDWDEHLPTELHANWFKWSEKLKQLNEIIIPRCFFKNSPPKCLNTLQLHTFVDASEMAYSCVVYGRILDNGIPKCAIIAAKTKVAPLKPLSIPRLELQAAVEGSRLTQKIMNALTLPVSERFLWSDSTTVLSWLRSDSRRYHQYVSCRVGEILRNSSINEWRHVPTKLNVADEATKWNAEPSFSPQCRWFTGPEFLRKPECEWPSKFKVIGNPEEEMRAVFMFHAQTFKPLVDYSRYSQFNRLLRAIVYVYRLVAWYQRRPRKGIFEADEIASAENFLWRQVQLETYSEEYNILLQNLNNPLEEQKSIRKGSSLYQMTPFMDDHHVMRMNSRIGAAPATPLEGKYPVLLPKDHRLTYLLIHQYHRRLLHGNNETVVNEMRQRFRIPHLRTLVKRVAKECQWCKVKKALPKLPIMAPLPAVRLTPFVKPFTHTGIDYFGPLMVKQGRSLVKRWVALFTCLTIRAVHLELVSSLSTQSCVMAIRRFIARRGSPGTFYSDNGTNFLGANNLLVSQIRNAHENCAVIFTNARTQWFFNPPATPHMGGPWERMVRSIKAAMDVISDHPQHPSEEVLETVMLEAESIVNSRPLTYVPLDAAESEALTPNHFILYGSTGIHQPVTPLEITNRTLRDSWNLAQTLVDKFWVRWVKEYLPMLTKRTKWFTPTKPLKPGDLVMVIDQQKRNGWVRARVVSVITAPDGQVRRAVVRSANGDTMKSVANLALLEVDGPSPDQAGCNLEPSELHGGENDENTPGLNHVSGVSPDCSLYSDI